VDLREVTEAVRGQSLPFRRTELAKFGAVRIRRLSAPILVDHSVLSQVECPPAGTWVALWIRVDRVTRCGAGHREDVSILFTGCQAGGHQIRRRSASYSVFRRVNQQFHEREPADGSGLSKMHFVISDVQYDKDVQATRGTLSRSGRPVA
jgi:hypothetical protein